MIAILVISHNFPSLTDSLCEKIKDLTKVDYDLHVIETGSNPSKFSTYATMWTNDQCRMTRGWNILKQHADYTARVKGYKYDAYHLFVNDAHFIDDQDLTGTLYEQMMGISNCGLIHPYQNRDMGPNGKRLENLGTGKARAESFAEIICPMILASAWNELPDLLDNRFYYGWGLDYDMPHQLHSRGYGLYISDKVGIHHEAFTSYRNKEITQEYLHEQAFIGLARTDMIQGLRDKYGDRWPEVITKSIPPYTDPTALTSWIRANDFQYLQDYGIVI